MKLAVKVVPGASRTQLAGWLGNELKIRVSAPPEKGKANKAVLRLLAKTLQIAENELTIVSGLTNSHKVIEIDHLSESEVKQKLDT